MSDRRFDDIQARLDDLGYGGVSDRSDVRWLLDRVTQLDGYLTDAIHALRQQPELTREQIAEALEIARAALDTEQT